MSNLYRKLSGFFGMVAGGSVILGIVFVGIYVSMATTTDFAQSQTIHRMQPLSTQTSDTAQTAPENNKLQNEKLRLEIAQLRLENANNDRSFSLRGLRNLLFLNLLPLATLAAGLLGFFRYFDQRRIEARNREDARFEEVVRGMGGDTEQKRMSSAVLLPTYLRPESERFYVQVFNVAAGNLRPSALNAADPQVAQGQSQPNPNGTKPSPLTQALANVLRESLSRT